MTDYPSSERMCLGCDGTGDSVRTEAYGRLARQCAGKHSWSRVSRSNDRIVWRCSHCYGDRVWERCPACLGTGKQTDRRTAEQAMVDAETFLALAPVKSFWHTLQHNGIRRTVYQATYAFLPIYAAYQHGKVLAHAAFRAVPALREE